MITYVTKDPFKTRRWQVITRLSMTNITSHLRIKQVIKVDTEKTRLVMHQLGFHLTSNHLMQYKKAKAKLICKTQGRVVCIRGLPSLTEKLDSYDVPQISDPPSTDGLTSSTTWLTTTCSPSFTTRSNNAMFNMMRDIKHDAWWWIQN